MGKTVLITGGTGFLGRYLINRISENYRTIILYRNASNLDEFKKMKVKNSSFVPIKSEFKEVENCFKQENISIIIHLATDYGRDGDCERVKRSNIDFPIKLFELGKKNGLECFCIVSAQTLQSLILMLI